MVLSIIISARNEFPQIVFTIQSIINDLETFLSPADWEVIVVSNCSDDEKTWRFVAERGLHYHRNVRFILDPIAGNVTSRNKGVAIARGEYVVFSDAHMSYPFGTFKRMLETMKESGGIVHGTVQWLGGYHPSQPSVQYSLKIGEKLWGTWNNAIVKSDDWFYVPCSGHCFLGVNRQQFIDFGGYNDYFRCYGGGELYLALKWWMLGSSVVVDPRIMSYHLSAGRGYSYHQDDLIHNMMLLGHSLKADALGERVYIRYMDKAGVNRTHLDSLYEQAQKEATANRDFLATRSATELYDVLIDRPWDRLNDQRHGRHQSYLAIYQDTWLSSLGNVARQYYDNSKLQQELDRIIRNDLSEFVYRG